MVNQTIPFYVNEFLENYFTMECKTLVSVNMALSEMSKWGASMMAGLIIRPFMETDHEALRNYCLPIEQAIYTSLPLKVIEDFRKDKYNLPMVIYLDEDLIGCFALYTDKAGNQYTSNENAILLKSFSLDLRHQKKGLAFKTLKVLPDLIKLSHPDKDEIILTVHHSNVPAINLYKKAGFIDKGYRFNGEEGEEFIFHFALN
ncbi:GNAT family protein [Peribacillus frigoritolerans]|uniref:GNAT family N-acetyltransferase n=1 Tax=Peribacillus frigoritolerans TaxID=450367 RepID=UPI003008E6B0